MRTSEMPLIARWLIGGLVLLALALTGIAPAQAQQAKKPNILILWGDDIGYWNVSAYNQGAGFLATFKECPPSQKVGSFSLDQVLENLTKGAGDK